MAALALECLVRREYRRLLEIAAASAGMLIVGRGDLQDGHPPRSPGSLAAPMPSSHYMPITNPAAAVHFLSRQLRPLVPYMGFDDLIIDVVLVLAGIAALIWLRRYALAAMFPIMLALVFLASAAHKYPFGNPRTSTFWLVAVPVLMAVAVAAAEHLAGRIDRRAPLLVAALALAVWVLRRISTSAPTRYPTRTSYSEITYLEAHFRHPGTSSLSATGPASGSRITTRDAQLPGRRRHARCYGVAYSVAWMVGCPTVRRGDVQTRGRRLRTRSPAASRPPLAGGSGSSGRARSVRGPTWKRIGQAPRWKRSASAPNHSVGPVPARHPRASLTESTTGSRLSLTVVSGCRPEDAGAERDARRRSEA